MAALKTAAETATRLDALLSQRSSQAGKVGELNEAVTGGIRRHVQSVLADMKRNDFDSDSAATDPASDEASQRIVRVLSKAMTPVVLEVDGVESEGDASDEEEEDEGVDAAYRTYRCVIQRCLVAAPPALEALALLTRAFSESPSVVGEELLLTLAAFTNKSVVRPWVPSAETAERASTQLRELLAASDTTQPRFIVEVVLQRYLRRLFSKSKPAAITSAGRKAEYVDPVAGRGEGLPDDTSETKPWKFTDFRAITLAGWVVGEADEELISKHWPLFIPVLLTLVDDQATNVRQQGLVVLKRFLEKFPSKTLRDTGLSKVFEDAIFPTLSYLPSLTPEEESLRLLVPAFEALRCLAGKQLPLPSAAASNQQQQTDQARDKLLDKVLREGIFSAYFHAKDYIRIVDVLCQQTTLIIGDMGIHAVKHLKDLIPMLTTILSDPFASSAAPVTLLSAIKTLQSVLANCWPRIITTTTSTLPDHPQSQSQSPWRDEIIQALVLCWLNLPSHQDGKQQQRRQQQQQNAEAIARLKQELIKCSQCLDAVIKANNNNILLPDLVAPLVTKEPSLAELFSVPIPVPTSVVSD